MNNTAVNNNLSTFPAVTQRALETMNTARNAWLEARRQQKAAADNIATIRQRRAEMEATTNTLNEEWRTLFRESQGVVSKEMKKLRTEIALGRETLEDFDELLAAQESENAKWHLNRSQFGIRIDHDLASISDHSLASQSITIWHASDH